MSDLLLFYRSFRRFFCATDMTSVKDGYGWDFCSEYVDFNDLEALPIFGSSDETKKIRSGLEADLP